MTAFCFLLAELLFTDSAADDGARIGADADVGFAWSGGAPRLALSGLYPLARGCRI